MTTFLINEGQQRFLETTTQTVGWFQKRLREHELTLKPLFQRNPVWTTTQKSYLLDSMIRGYPVPEIYLQMLESENGTDEHVVVDGQQRIRACLEFLEDKFALAEGDMPWSGLPYSELTPPLQRSVRQYKFSVRILPDLDEGLLREIFGRLNRNNMALNNQELRNATYWGRFIATMQDLATDDFWVESRIFTANDFRRMLDVEYMSELSLALLYGPQNKKSSLDHYYEAFEEEFPDEVGVRTLFRKTISVLREIVDWSQPGRWAKKSDFYTLFSYIANRIKRAGVPVADDMNLLKERLILFGRKVDGLLFDSVSAPDSVKDYSRYVQRAASDIKSRRVRAAALTAYLEDTEYERDSESTGNGSTGDVDLLELSKEADDQAEDE